ncbi:amidohydrolase family protein [bacterium]|nr:amidohydrolase family protein [bacterium]
MGKPDATRDITFPEKSFLGTKMIIDVHTHIFPDHIAANAVKFLAEEADVPAFTGGKKSDLLDSMRQAGIGQSWLQPVATKPKQVDSINQMMKDIQAEGDPALVPFGAMHPDYENLPAMIRDLSAHGIPGIKIHPEYHQISPLDERLFPLYEALIEENMAILYHAGIDIGIPTLNSTPHVFAQLNDRYPQLILILAHMGGFRQWYDVFKDLAGRDVYLDTSYLVGLSDESFITLARAHGMDKVVFGTDSPWSDQKTAVEHFQSLALTEEEKQRIFHDNAAALLTKLRGE